MRRRVCLIATGLPVFLFALVWSFNASGQESPPSKSKEPAAQADQQEPAKLKGTVFMGAKLKATQDVLQGLLTRDFEGIGEAALSLRDVALTTPPTQVRAEFDAEIYDHFRHEFLRLSGQLNKLAEAENLEGAAYVHQNLTSTCISCHEYVRDKTLP
ncbi:MAG: hypothetical protein AB8G99_07690 [Planctomycetaceae bacterium]